MHIGTSQHLSLTTPLLVIQHQITWLTANLTVCSLTHCQGYRLHYFCSEHTTRSMDVKSGFIRYPNAQLSTYMLLSPCEKFSFHGQSNLRLQVKPTRRKNKSRKSPSHASITCANRGVTFPLTLRVNWTCWTIREKQTFQNSVLTWSSDPFQSCSRFLPKHIVREIWGSRSSVDEDFKSSGTRRRVDW
jgi:hypothetical protein